MRSIYIQKIKNHYMILLNLSIILLFLCGITLLSFAALATQDETYGIVTNVIDGDTFDVTIEKADSRIAYNVERIRLADVDSPEMDTSQGPDARDFTYAVLMNKRVYLDIDDLSSNGRDSYGRLVSVAYLAGFYGQPLSAPNFNRLLVDSGHAELKNFTDNEFSPEDWWSERDSQPIDEPLQGIKQNLQKEFLPKLQDSAEKEFDRVAKDGLNWLKGQISVKFSTWLF